MHFVMYWSGSAVSDAVWEELVCVACVCACLCLCMFVCLCVGSNCFLVCVHVLCVLNVHAPSTAAVI